MSRLGRPAQILVVLSVSVLFLLPWVTAQSSPRQAALQTFEAIRAAEDSGANVDSMISQYNNLLQQNATDSSYNSLIQLANNAQASALSERDLGNTATLVLVPIIALLLTICTLAIVRFWSRFEEERMLEMEIRRE